MTKNMNQKRKMLYIRQILEHETDEEHGITIAELIARLASVGIKAERKSIYDDIDCLKNFGMDIRLNRGSRFEYYLAQRSFETAELKLLVDAVQVAKVLTAEQSRQLIGKIETLTSIHEAHKLNRHIFIQGRSKTANDEIYEAIDTIHEAILDNRQVRFRYFDWTVKKEKQFRHDGGVYEMSPWALAWNEEKYYLIAYDSDKDIIKHFRIDKMTDVHTIDRARAGQAHFADFHLDDYSNSVFGMFSGEERRVTLSCDNDMIGVIIDRFGKEVMIMPDARGFRVNVPVVISPWFFSWLFGFSAKIRIAAPADVREEYCRQLAKNLEQYAD
ncbi:MAG: WYL domain-containing protein [Selenomonadales bacterium]|nr:WYL domain-containing protein [Selenomonadales bacterium]